MTDERIDATNKSDQEPEIEPTKSDIPASPCGNGPMSELKPDNTTTVSFSGPSPFGPEVGDNVVENDAEQVTQVEIRTKDLVISIRGAGITTVRRTIRSRLGARSPKPRSKDRVAEHLNEPHPHVQVHRAAYEKLRDTVGRLPAERGGIFVGSDPFCVEDFIFDRGSNPGSAVYYPDAAYLNEILERDHEPFGRRFVGVAHSHPSGFWRPSGDENWGDIKAAINNLIAKSNRDLPALFIPIIESAAMTGKFVIHPFVMMREGLCLRRAQYEVIDEVNCAGS